MSILYKIVPRTLWQEAVAKGRFEGAPVDHADGFIHLSSAEQVRETAAKHFRGQSDLLLVGLESDRLGDALKWEVSRGGSLFPHLYASLDPADVSDVLELPLDESGAHRFPETIG